MHCAPGPRTCVAALLLAASLAVGGCGRGGAATGHVKAGVIRAVGAESEYANVISQIGGRYVSVTAIMSNPSSDPHSFEANPGVAQAVAAAKLIVQNGAGYDGFMDKIESGAGTPGRTVIDVRRLLELPADVRNPHLWYDPATMPKLAQRLVEVLSALERRHAAYFAANARHFNASLKPWRQAIARFRREHGGTPVATTEPVGDYLLQAAGAENMTAWQLQADIMNGVDPAPQEISAEQDLLTGHRIKAFLYNDQVTDTVTQSFLTLAATNHIPVVGVYETMPRGHSYQSWMLDEIRALTRAVTTGRSTRSLG